MDINLNHHDVTFSDIAVRELAKQSAACICRRQFKRCTNSECIICSLHEDYMNCFNQMSDYDKLRLNNYTTEYYLQYSRSPMQWMEYIQMKKHILKWVIGIGIMLVAFVLLLLNSCSMTKVRMPEQTFHPQPIEDKYFYSFWEFKELVPDYNSITNSIRDVNAFVALNKKDLNHDGIVNCQDIVVMWKGCWDNSNKGIDCYIVWNDNNYTGFHHLFICLAILGTDGNTRFLEVEPQAIGNDDFNMIIFWGMLYDRRYNDYTTTDYWMRLCHE